MIEKADVLIEGLRPGVMERLGLGPDVALARNPRLIYARMTRWGQNGPIARTAGHDLTFLALTGALDAIGPADGLPVPPLNLVGDMGGGGTFLVIGNLATLLERQKSGLGQVIDAAIVDGTVSQLAMILGLRGGGLWERPRGENLLDGGLPFYRTYRCSDGKFVAVGALEPKFFANLIRGLGLDPTLYLPRQYDRAGGLFSIASSKAFSRASHAMIGPRCSRRRRPASFPCSILKRPHATLITRRAPPSSRLTASCNPLLPRAFRVRRLRPARMAEMARPRSKSGALPSSPSRQAP